MVYTKRAEMAAVSRGTSHVTTQNAVTLVDIKNALYKASHSFRITCNKTSASLLESEEHGHIKALINQKRSASRFGLALRR